MRVPPKSMILLMLLFCDSFALDGGDPVHEQFPTVLQSEPSTSVRTAMIMENGVSVPSNFPHVNITVNDNPDTGLVFLSTSWNSYPQYSMILDNSGNPVWYICTEGEERRDFKVQPNGWLTMLIRDGYGGSNDNLRGQNERSRGKIRRLVN